MSAAHGPVYVGYTATSLWQGDGKVAGVVAVDPGHTPQIGQCGNAYTGPCPHDIETQSDAAEYRLGIRTKDQERAAQWLVRRLDPHGDSLAMLDVARSLVREATVEFARRRDA